MLIKCLLVIGFVTRTEKSQGLQLQLLASGLLHSPVSEAGLEFPNQPVEGDVMFTVKPVCLS